MTLILWFQSPADIYFLCDVRSQQILEKSNEKEESLPRFKVRKKNHNLFIVNNGGNPTLSEP